jgi:dTDP-4-dehydrorhamnose reductase
MRILITGAGGLLGGRLATLLTETHETTGLIRAQPAPEGIPAIALDLADQTAVNKAMTDLRPDAVVHSAALADAEICERDPDRAHRDNVEATRAVATACRQTGARLITISTDLVFAGDGVGWAEDSLAVPRSVYGRAKLLAEEEAMKACPDAVVLRVALVAGRGHGPRLSASESIAQRLGRGETATLYDDEWRTPVDAESVAAAIGSVLERSAARGRFHLGGEERLTRFELGERVARLLDLDPVLIRRASQATHKGAPRPRDVSLDIGRAREELGFRPRSLDAVILEGRRA